MITRAEALRRLDAVAHELVALRAALASGWTETPSDNLTQAFLTKCASICSMGIRHRGRSFLPVGEVYPAPL